MKYLNKILLVILLLGAVGACKNLDLELQENPNAPAPENANLNDLYNSLQLTFGSIYEGAEFNPGLMARMYTAAPGFTYRAATTPNTYNFLWGQAYEGLFPDVQALELINENAEGQKFNTHLGTAYVMQAYTMMVLVDLFGDVPWSEAGQGTTIISPAPDPGADVYAAAIARLDEAIALLGDANAPAPTVDNFYDGDRDAWITAANTLKMRAALNQRDASAFNAAVNAGVIDDIADDWQAQYGNQRTNPNSRHYNYNNHYEVADGDYLSNYYMWLLRSDKEDSNGSAVADPRLRYYFYRKVDDAVGQDATTYSCHFSTLPDQAFAPDHWEAVDPRLPYCVAHPDGWSGRDHLNGEGIPPDGPIRTSYGLYPAGGLFDDDTFQDTRANGSLGGLGEGVSPVLISPVVDLMRAEAVLTIGAAGDARSLLESGVTKSLDKVESFESIVASQMATSVTLRDGSEGTVKELYGMDADSKQAYIDFVMAAYDAADADGKLDIVVKEQYLAAWGNGLEAYNMYRRTGKPNNMTPALEPQPGPFPLSMFYPADGVTRNSNLEQKADLTTPVFWQDGGVASQLY